MSIGSDRSIDNWWETTGPVVELSADSIHSSARHTSVIITPGYLYPGHASTVWPIFISSGGILHSLLKHLTKKKQTNKQKQRTKTIPDKVILWLRAHWYYWTGWLYIACCMECIGDSVWYLNYGLKMYSLIELSLFHVMLRYMLTVAICLGKA